MIRRKRLPAKVQANRDARGILATGRRPVYSGDGTFTLQVPGDPDSQTFGTDKLLGVGKSGLFNRRKKLATRAYQLMAQEEAIQQAKARAAAAQEQVTTPGGTPGGTPDDTPGGEPGGKPPGGKTPGGEEGKCPEGQKMQDGKCVDVEPEEKKCPEGTTLVDGECVEGETPELASFQTPLLTSDLVFDATDDDFWEKGFHNLVNSDVPVKEEDLAVAAEKGYPYMNNNGQIVDVQATLDNLNSGVNLEEAIVLASYGKAGLENVPTFSTMEEAQRSNYGFNPTFLDQGMYSPFIVGSGANAKVYYLDQDMNLVDSEGETPFVITERQGLDKTPYLALRGMPNEQNRGEIMGPLELGMTAAMLWGPAKRFAKKAKMPSPGKFAKSQYARFKTPNRNYVNPVKRGSKTVSTGSKPTAGAGPKPVRKVNVKKSNIKPGKTSQVASKNTGITSYAGSPRTGYAMSPMTGIGPKTQMNMTGSVPFKSPTGNLTSMTTPWNQGVPQPVQVAGRTPMASYGPATVKRPAMVRNTNSAARKAANKEARKKNPPSIKETREWAKQNKKGKRPTSKGNTLAGKNKTLKKTAEGIKKAGSATKNFVKKHPWWTAAGVATATNIADGISRRKKSKKQFGGILFK